MSASVALMLIDLQRDFLDDAGRLRVHRAQVEPLLQAAGRLVEEARASEVPVIHVVNAFPRGSIANIFRKFAAIEGSPGAALDPRGPQPIEGDLEIAKRAASAFSEPALDAFLKTHGVQQLIIAGVFAGGCVSATARAARALGYAVSLSREAVADRSERARDRALRRLSAAGCVVTDELSPVLTTSAFKEAS